MDNENKLSAQNRKYFEFIDELKKNARADSPTAEISRFYKEVADILAEAYDEYNPSDLPKYQDRLENILRLSTTEISLDDPLFKEDLKKATELLDQKVKQRFGVVQKISHLGSQTARVFGSVSTHVGDFLQIGDQAAAAGRRLNQINFGWSRRKVDAEEERRQYDLLQGNSGQYSDAGSSGEPKLLGGNTRLALPPVSVTPVKDEKLIGTNTQQNKVLLQLFNVTKDSNTAIKQIKTLLITDNREEDDRHERLALGELESNQERAVSVKKADKGLIAGLGGSLAMAGIKQESKNESEEFDKKEQESHSSGMGLSDAILGGWAGAKGIKWLGRLLKGTPAALRTGGGILAGGLSTAAGGLRTGLTVTSEALGATALTTASSPAALVAGGTALGAYGGIKAGEYLAPPVKRTGQSISASLGEKIKGIDYYKQLFQQKGLDQEGQDRAEQWALEYLQAAARRKRDLFDAAYQNGAVYGNGSYQIDGIPQKIDEAIADVKAAEDKAKEYQDYLSARNKKGRGLSATATFKMAGKVYTNPLYSEDELPTVKPRRSSNSDNGNFELLRSDTGEAEINRGMDKGDQDLGDTIAAPSDIDTMINGIAAAETGAITKDKGLLDESRFIRTTAGANSSAYGPLQITKSLAEGALNNGVLDHDTELKKWTQEKFIPQGEKFLKSNYSDKRFGAGGMGDLNTPADRAMYEKLARSLVSDTMNNNKGDTLGTIGEWRFGAGRKNALMSEDPNYAYRVASQIKRDQQVMMAANQSQKVEMAAVSQQPRQLAMNQLTRDAEDSKNHPIVVPVVAPSPTPAPQQMASNISTKTVGASPNGVSDSSMILGIRHSISPLG